ncbi:endonuclease/exonuclease/phosphatase family protein [Allorhizocola rhizosphaerae]|uniref:endonuclease/exonuclease/phosphatase family protein n=1 Tax=Allorhizocola rhizosphaerae TaxID=1872709 RepID=UPI003CCC506C
MGVGIGLRVVTYNVHSLRDDVGALALLMRELEPDIAIIQEAPRRWRWRTRCARLAHSFGLYYAAGGLPALGNLILTTLRVRVESTWHLRYPLTPGRHMRGAAFARCTVPGTDPFVVSGSHLSTHDREREAQATLLLRALDSFHDPVILGADLNETPDGPAWQMLASGRTDPGSSPTFPARSPDRRIDALLIDPRITVDSCFVADTPLAVQSSDHLPLTADLTFPHHRAHFVEQGREFMINRKG